jgi:hypothetical protein
LMVKTDYRRCRHLTLAYAGPIAFEKLMLYALISMSTQSEEFQHDLYL